MANGLATLIYVMTQVRQLAGRRPWRNLISNRIVAQAEQQMIKATDRKLVVD